MADAGGYRFWDWFACPECNEHDGISSLAHATTIVMECYACGHVDEYVIGLDVALQNLDIDAIEGIAEETADTSP